MPRPACGRIVWVVVGVLQDGTNIVGSGVLQVLGGAVFDEPIGQLGPVLATGVWADELAKEKKSMVMIMMIRDVLTANKRDRREI